MWNATISRLESLPRMANSDAPSERMGVASELVCSHDLGGCYVASQVY